MRPVENFQGRLAPAGHPAGGRHYLEKLVTGTAKSLSVCIDRSYIRGVLHQKTVDEIIERARAPESCGAC